MDPWHYPRTEFAQFIIGGMKQGLLQRVSIFAPRKRGKTQFIQYDVMPLCREQGILPIYIDFWLDKNDPQSVFIKSVLAACEQEESIIQKIGKRLISSNMSYNVGGTNLEVGFSREAVEVVLFDVFQKLNKLNVPILLLLDEVQHLATKKEFEPFTAALRSFVVNRADNQIKCIFTGSSREGLNQLFRNSKAPFYNSSQTLDFAELDVDFVNHELAIFREMTSGVALDPEQALNILIQQNRAPARFVEMLQNMILFKEYDLVCGKRRFDHDEEKSQHNFQQICDALKVLDLTILKLIAMNQASGIYTEKGIEKVKLFAEDDSLKVTKDTIKNAINRLKDENYIYSPSRGKWTIENPEFRDFLLQM